MGDLLGGAVVRVWKMKNKKGATVGPWDRTGCAFDSQTECLLEKASCSESRTGYSRVIGRELPDLSFMSSGSGSRDK
jgi:hypothetical protein